MVNFFAWHLWALVISLASMAMVAVKPEVTALSDDEPVPGVVQPPPAELVPVEKKTTRKTPCAAQIRARLGKLLNFQCTCARHAKGEVAQSCFKQFQADVESVFQLVWKLRNLDKQDMDNEAGTDSRVPSRFCGNYLPA